MSPGKRSSRPSATTGSLITTCANATTIGPGDTWWGADMAIVPLGKGRCIASQLRLVENLGKDPVADRLLMNMIRFTASSTP